MYEPLRRGLTLFPFGRRVKKRVEFPNHKAFSGGLERRATRDIAMYVCVRNPEVRDCDEFRVWNNVSCDMAMSQFGAAENLFF